jgi:hypothetical protein
VRDRAEVNYSAAFFVSCTHREVPDLRDQQRDAACIIQHGRSPGS